MIPVTDEMLSEIKWLLANASNWYLEEALNLKGGEYNQLRKIARGTVDSIDEDLYNRVTKYLEQSRNQ